MADFWKNCVTSVHGFGLLSMVRDRRLSCCPCSELIVYYCNNFSGAGISERPWLNLEMAPSKQMKQEQVVL